MKWKVLVDTNVLLKPFEVGLRLWDEIKRVMPVAWELVVLSPVEAELVRLAESKQAAKVALALLKRLPHQIVDVEGKADDAIVQFAKEHECVVATQDAGIKKQLKGMPLIVVRGRHLELRGFPWD